jgi:C1A family cysteine protease
MSEDSEIRAHKIQRYGWIPDFPDHRDLLYAAPVATLAALPAKVDLPPHCPPVYDQGQLGSCTANAIGAAIEFDRMKQKLHPDFVPSRLFIYYNERVIEHTVNTDSGAQIRDGIKSVAKQGACKEETWPYEPVEADPETHLFPPHSPPRTKPPAAAYHEARQYKAVAYYRLQQSLAQMKGCLADGFPFVFGFTVYDSLYDAGGNPKTELPMPSGTDNVLGGHAVLAVGYDDSKQLFTVRNSWGTGVQDGGYFYIPYAYLVDDNLAADFWTIRGMRA